MSIQCRELSASVGLGAPLDRHAASSSGHSTKCQQNDWALLMDMVLVSTAMLLRPLELCLMASVCTAWAEVLTSSEACLWFIVGNVGLTPSISDMLRRWAGVADTSMRTAMQLWLCRAHLWQGPPGASGSASSSVVAVTYDGAPPSDGVPVCCDVAGGHLAIGFARGVLSFSHLVTELAPTRSLHGVFATGFEQVSRVRAAHGDQLITATRPLETGRAFVSCGLDGLLRTWDHSSGSETTQIVTGHERGMNDVVVGLGGERQLLSCGDDGRVLLHSLEARHGAPPLQRFEGHTAAAYCVVWTSSSTCVSGGFDRRAHLWDCRTSSRPMLTMPSRHHIHALAPLTRSGSADASCNINGVAVGAADGTISHWDLRRTPATEPLREMRGHSAAVEALTCLPGSVLASASADGTLLLWDALYGGKPTWAWHRGSALTCLAAVTEDTLLVAGTAGPPVLLSLDYQAAAPLVPSALNRLSGPSLQPWKREGGGTSALPDGPGRHQALLGHRRRLRGSPSRKPDVEVPAREPRGCFDRSAKARIIPLGSTGAAHRTYLSGLRR